MDLLRVNEVIPIIMADLNIPLPSILFANFDGKRSQSFVCVWEILLYVQCSVYGDN